MHCRQKADSLVASLASQAAPKPTVRAQQLPCNSAMPPMQPGGCRGGVGTCRGARSGSGQNRPCIPERFSAACKGLRRTAAKFMREGAARRCAPAAGWSIGAPAGQSLPARSSRVQATQPARLGALCGPDPSGRRRRRRGEHHLRRLGAVGLAALPAAGRLADLFRRDGSLADALFLCQCHVRSSRVKEPEHTVARRPRRVWAGPDRLAPGQAVHRAASAWLKRSELPSGRWPPPSSACCGSLRYF